MSAVTFVALRLAKKSVVGRGAVSGNIANVVMALGVASLVCITGVMNGFQASFIDALVEVSSYHILIRPHAGASLGDIAGEKSVLCAIPFQEAQSLLVCDGISTGVIIRALGDEAMKVDKGFAKEVHVLDGKFDLSKDDAIALSDGVAAALNADVGSKVSALALSGGRDVDLIDKTRVFTVCAIFSTGYYALNESLVFCSASAGKRYFGEDCPVQWGIKLRNKNDAAVVAKNILAKMGGGADVATFTQTNRSYFAILKTEKTILLLVLLLVIIVVAVNIFSATRRQVAECSSDIAILRSFGLSVWQVVFMFVFRTFVVAVAAVAAGVVLGLAFTLNMHSIFLGIGNLINSDVFEIYAAIPARLESQQVAFFVVFSIVCPVFASFFATKSISSQKVAEVLRYE